MVLLSSFYAQDLFYTHRRLYEGLYETYPDKPGNLRLVFEEMKVELMTLYADYCSHHKKNLERYNELLAKYPSVKTDIVVSITLLLLHISLIIYIHVINNMYVCS